jgi:hypothetical protein
MGVTMRDESDRLRRVGVPQRSLYFIEGPTSWPQPPALMSFTALRDIETCPLRWGLRNGEYAGLWTGKGYPTALTGATITGHIVHVALERVVRAISAVRDGSSIESGDDSSRTVAIVVGALKALGGISAVLEGVIRENVSHWDLNPRLRPRVKELENDLRRQLPSMRTRVQQFLSRVDLSPVHRERALTASDRGAQVEGYVAPLAPGLHAEVPLVNEELGWKGKADLLRVGTEIESAGNEEILDFKTGLPKPDHALQLRIYALLWAREARRNPSGRRARKLTVLYVGSAVDVPAPITDEELDSLAYELADRTAKARAGVERHPPTARPSREACEWCDVRQMCSAYWAPATRVPICSTEPSRRQFDVGVQVRQQQGIWSWVAQVREVGALCDDVSIGTEVLLRARAHDEHFGSLIRAGARLRLVGAQFEPSSDESGGLPVLSLTRSTEAFVVDLDSD